jgi:hypothetical protein
MAATSILRHPLRAGTSVGFHPPHLLRHPSWEQSSSYPRRAASETSHPLPAMCVLECCLIVKTNIIGTAFGAS